MFENLSYATKSIKYSSLTYPSCKVKSVKDFTYLEFKS